MVNAPADDDLDDDDLDDDTDTSGPIEEVDATLRTIKWGMRDYFHRLEAIIGGEAVWPERLATED